MTAPSRHPAFALVPAGMILAALLTFLLVSRLGAGLDAGHPAPEGQAARSGGKTAALPQVLLALAVIVVAARAAGAAFARLGQPPVIGEVVAGILLGPSSLGALAPDATASLFPADVTGHLGNIAQLGVILYLFVVGLELDTELVARQGLDSVAIAASGMAAPFRPGLAARAGAVPAPRDPGRAVHRVCAVHGGGAVGHRVPGPGPHPDRPGAHRYRAGQPGAGLRRGR